MSKHHSTQSSHDPSSNGTHSGADWSSPEPPKLPAEPTDALPGTEAKITVLEDRAARGEELWHPTDAAGLETIRMQVHEHLRPVAIAAVGAA